MTDESMLTAALRCAVDAHAGQPDKQGHPYILHVLRVVMAMSTDEERTVAALHDVVEDTSVTLSDLRARSFPSDIVLAVGALTRRKTQGETYAEYIERVALDPLAVRVKLADLADNLRPERIAMLEPNQAASLSKRYHAAYRRLMQEG